MPTSESANAPGRLQVGGLSIDDASAVIDLNRETAKHDQVAPLSETPLLRLRTEAPWLTHLLIRENSSDTALPGRVLAYAQIDRSGEEPSAELVVHPQFRRRGIGSQLLRIAEQDARIPSVAGTAGQAAPQLRIWAHGNIDPAKSFAQKHNYAAIRELMQLFRPLRHVQRGPNPWVSTWRSGSQASRNYQPTPVNVSRASKSFGSQQPPTQPMPVQSIAELAQAQAEAIEGINSEMPDPISDVEIVSGTNIAGQTEHRLTKGDKTEILSLAEIEEKLEDSDGPDSPEFQLRSYQPGTDDEPWIAVNSIIFADHPEQGRLAIPDLHERMAQPWFDPRGFFVLATPDGSLAGYCWTKVPQGVGVDDTTGEIYAIGVDPKYQGQGLGAFLLEASLAHLTAMDLAAVRLFTESDNQIALKNYHRAGFEQIASDVQYAKI